MQKGSKRSVSCSPSSSRWHPNPTGEMKRPVSPSARRLPLSL
jgi:hypothetical protein